LYSKGIIALHIQRELFLKDFQYELPSELVAQHPSQCRDDARLFVRLQSGESLHRQFKELPTLLPPGSLLIVNDSRVFASRLFGLLETGGRIEVFLLEKPIGFEARAMARPMKKLKVGTRLLFSEEVSGIIIEKVEKEDSAEVRIRFTVDKGELMHWIDRSGSMPLPPYIGRKLPDARLNLQDRERYQTVYAEDVGSVAAPTAGLHFTKSLIEQLKASDIEVAAITLHVGAGTFLPVKCETLSRHKMHEESFLVTKELIEKVAHAKMQGRRVIPVGTTTFRCLESLYLAAKKAGVDPVAIADRWQSTDLFIRPSSASDIYENSFADGIITNFHQPGSTLLMLISALIGYDACRKHYEEAARLGYRFFSYGDSNLFWF
jgi:S-adenosylmethionine:tRNA ribosyltransferase-isomerase